MSDIEHDSDNSENDRSSVAKELRRSSSENEENIEELLNDGYLKDNKRLTKVRNQTDSDELESDDIEDEGDSNRMPRNSRPTTYKTTDSFVVDDDGNSMEQTVIQVAASRNSQLPAERLQQAWNFVNSDRTTVQNFIERPKTTNIREITRSKTQELRIEGNFDRELYNCVIPVEAAPDATDWIFNYHFKKRMSANQDGDEIDEEDPETKAQKTILANILSRMLSEEDEDGNLSIIHTPQFIIKHLSDIYKSDPNTIYVDNDIYTILACFKRYKWIYNKFSTFSEYTPVNDNMESDLLDFCNQVISTVTDELINDMTRYNSYVLPNGEGSGAQVVFAKQRANFKDLVSEFLLTPEQVAYKIYLTISAKGDHIESIEPPEPTSFPEVRLNNFLDSNEEYSELIRKEIEAGRERRKKERLLSNVDDDDDDVFFDTRAEKIKRLKEQIIRYAATELSINPIFLQLLREQIADSIVVNTFPTERGEQSHLLLPYNKFGPVKRLKGKMIASFSNTDTWLLIDEARKQGFITVDINWTDGDSTIQEFYENFEKQFYLSQYGSQWDDIRQAIIESAFKDSIWPQFQKEAESQLWQKSAEAVKNTVEGVLLQKLTAPPYTKQNQPSSPLVGVSILSFCYHPDSPKEVGVCLVNPNGRVQSNFTVSSRIFGKSIRTDELIDTIQKSKNTKKVQISATDVSKNEEFEGKKRIYQAIEKEKPDLITICSTCLRARDLYSIVENLAKCAPAPSNSSKYTIIFAPSDAAIVYARSQVSKPEEIELSKQLPTQGSKVSPSVLIAASTARRVQNPLHELTRLCTRGKNYLVNIPLHPFQNKFIEEGKESGVIHEACELACIKAVAISGVDVSQLHLPEHQGALQFIPGFGPAFAEFILTKYGTDKSLLQSRSALQFAINDFPYISDDAISFLRFPGVRNKRDDPDRYEEKSQDKLLDGTMIHPAHYSIAEEMIKFFAKDQNGDRLYSTDSEIDESKIRKFFLSPQHIIYKTDKGDKAASKDQLNQFFNSDYYSEEDMTLHKLLKSIAKELTIGPFETFRFKKRKNLRDLYRPFNPDNSGLFRPHESLKDFNKNVQDIIRSAPKNYYCPMTSDELFDALVNDPTIKENSITDFQIFKYYPNEGQCLAKTATSGVDAVSNRDFNSFSEYQDNVRGMVFQGAILNIDKAQMKLIVTFSPKELENLTKFENYRRMDSFDLEGEIEAQKRRKEEEKNKPHRYYARFIEDEHFKNITPTQAVAELQTMEIGDYLIRPSTKGNDKLDLLIKFPGNSYGIYEIIEKEKKSRGDLTLGKKLSIDMDQFEDLDDIHWNFVEKIKEKLDKIMRHKRWEPDIDRALQALSTERNANPNLATYRITVEPELKSTVCFMWISKDGQLIKEPIRPTPSEYRYRHDSYANGDFQLYDFQDSQEYIDTMNSMFST